MAHAALAMPMQSSVRRGYSPIDVGLNATATTRGASAKNVHQYPFFGGPPQARSGKWGKTSRRLHFPSVKAVDQPADHLGDGLQLRAQGGVADVIEQVAAASEFEERDALLR